MADHTQAAKGLTTLFKSGMQSSANARDALLFVARTLMPLLARPLITQMGIPTSTSPIVMLDSACGTGVVVREAQLALKEAGVLEGSRFVAGDSSEMLVDVVKGRVKDEGWPATEVEVLDAIDTKLPADTFTHVSIALGLHLIPKPDDVLLDTIRVSKPNAVIGFTTFQSPSPHDFWRKDLRTAFASFPFHAPFPDVIPMQLHDSGNWTDREAIHQHLITSPLYKDTLTDVQVNNVVGTHRFERAEEWVMAFGSMLGWVMGSWWDEETRQAHPVEEVKGLILEHLREKYGDGGWEVSWELVVATARVN